VLARFAKLSEAPAQPVAEDPELIEETEAA
jgi:hypothetical protein